MDPETAVPWIKTLLNNPRICEEVCGSQFRKHDDDANGTLEINEVQDVVMDVCSIVSVEPPGKDKVVTMFEKFDRNHDTHLSSDEFKPFFKALLMSAKQLLEKEVSALQEGRDTEFAEARATEEARAKQEEETRRKQHEEALRAQEASLPEGALRASHLSVSLGGIPVDGKLISLSIKHTVNGLEVVLQGYKDKTEKRVYEQGILEYGTNGTVVLRYTGQGASFVFDRGYCWVGGSIAGTKTIQMSPDGKDLWLAD